MLIGQVLHMQYVCYNTFAHPREFSFAPTPLAAMLLVRARDYQDSKVCAVVPQPGNEQLCTRPLTASTTHPVRLHLPPFASNPSALGDFADEVHQLIEEKIQNRTFILHMVMDPTASRAPCQLDSARTEWFAWPSPRF